MAYQSILANFRIDPIDKLKYYCLVESCAKQVMISKSNKSNNFKRHLLQHHKEIHDGTCVDLVDYEIQRLKLIQSGVELVTVNGRPLIALEDTVYQKSIEFQLKYLAQHGCKLTMNAKNIKPYISHIADGIRQKLKIELNNRFISVMTDIATKNHRAVLGINVQYHTILREK